MKMKCVGINHNYTMSVSLLILAPLSADQNQGQFYIVIYKINNSELLEIYIDLYSNIRIDNYKSKINLNVL